MAKKTWLCCERCGDIFEGTDGTQYCESCRNILYSMRARAEHVCKQCGEKFIGGKSAIYCMECKRMRCNDYQREYQQEKRAKEKEHEKQQENTFTCKDCGKSFTSPMKFATVCDECKAKHRNIEREYTCVTCGATFTTTATTAWNCPDCRRKRQQIQKAFYQKKTYTDKLPPLPRTKKKKNATLMEDIKQATALGISYGEYMAKR